jgi:hypothetical protein
MKRVKAILDFIKLAVAAKISFYRNVITKLTDSPIYVTPDVPLTEAKASVDKLETAFIAAKDGSHTAVSAMYDAEDAADDIFRILAAYVNRISAGDETAILSSGFNSSKQPVTSQKAVLAVEDGDNSGSVYLVARAIDRAGAYIWQFAKGSLPATEEGWTQAGHSTRAYYELPGLTVGSIYYFRFAAITPDGTTDYVPAVMKVVV